MAGKQIKVYLFEIFWKSVNTLLNRNSALIVEHMEVDFVLSNLHDKKSIRVLDIGAHHGEFIKIFRKTKSKKKFEIFSIEPLKFNRFFLHFEKLMIFLRRKGNVDIISGALGESSDAIFYLGNSTALFTSDLNWVSKFSNNFINSSVISIKGISVEDLRNYLANKINFDFIKIDVEGQDLNILKKLIQSEFTFSYLMIEFSENYQEIVKYLTKVGFDLIFVFLRDGIKTKYIGAALSDLELQKRIQNCSNLHGNIVVFKN
jgi:FkbM family methyltransferase